MVVLGVWFLESVQRRVRVVFGETGVLKRQATSEMSDRIKSIFCYTATGFSHGSANKMDSYTNMHVHSFLFMQFQNKLNPLCIRFVLLYINI